MRPRLFYKNSSLWRIQDKTRKTPISLESDSKYNFKKYSTNIHGENNQYVSGIRKTCKSSLSTFSNLNKRKSSKR